MNRAIFLSVFAAVFGAGCSTFDVQHACPLEGGTTCSNLTQNYKQAKRVQNGAAHSRQSIYSNGAPQYEGGPPPGAYPHVPGWAPPAYQEVFQGFTPPGESGHPVFKQPRVHRAWVAPWTDANGRMHSGEYLYYTTPGEWNYGTLRQPGAAGAAMMGPVKPSQLGFRPDLTPTKKPVPVPAPRSQAAPQPEPVQAETQAVGIVQPQSRFGEDQ